MDYTITKQIKEVTDFLEKKISQKPKMTLVLGSGLGKIADEIENQFIVPYEEIPHFQKTSVEGHSGRIIFGEIDGIPVGALQGRWHYYEGYPMSSVVLPTRAMCMLGAEHLFLTNAAGGINLDFQAGDLMIIEDHINFMGDNPLTGKEPATFGPRFPDLSETYCSNCISILEKNAKELQFPIKKGVYGAVHGPTYETPAEVRMFRTMGIDAVGMSTVPEAIAAKHLGALVTGVSCITNMAAGVASEPLSHKEVQEEAHKVLQQFSKLVVKSIPEFFQAKA